MKKNLLPIVFILLSSIGLSQNDSRTLQQETEMSKYRLPTDKNAVKHGMIKELVKSKKFGRNPKYFPMSYVNKLHELYPSVDDVKKWDATTLV